MPAQPPKLFHNNETVTFRLTAPEDYRIPFTLVEALNEGTLFDRAARVFEEAARNDCLYEVVVGDDNRIIGTGMFQSVGTEKNNGHRREELGSLMVHPSARGVGIMGLLVKIMMVHRFGIVLAMHKKEEDVAHVLVGNQGPINGLLAAGFEKIGPVKMYPDEFDGDMSHMMAPGESFVRFHAFRFNRSAVTQLIHELWAFQHEERRLERPDWKVRLHVNFAQVVCPEFLDEEVKRLQP